MSIFKSIFGCCVRDPLDEEEARAPVHTMVIGSPTDFIHNKTMTHEDAAAFIPMMPLQARPNPASGVASSNAQLDESSTLAASVDTTSVPPIPTEHTTSPKASTEKDTSMPRTTPSGAGLPKTWVKDMDRYIAYLDGAGEVDYKVIAMRLKAKFPELGPYSITGDIIDRRLKFLEYQPADYLDKDETGGGEASATPAGFREGLEVAKAAVKHNTGQDLDTIEPVNYDKYVKRPAATGPAKGGILKNSTSERSVQNSPTTAPIAPSTSKNSLTAPSVKQAAYGQGGANRKENEPLSDALPPADLGMTIKKINRSED